jgi:hypothetical protein
MLAIASAIGTFPEPVVNLTAVFGVSAAGDVLGIDGVQPSLGGQTAIARAVVEQLTPILVAELGGSHD